MSMGQRTQECFHVGTPDSFSYSVCGHGHKGASSKNAGILSAVTVLTSDRAKQVGGIGRQASSIKVGD